MKKIILVLLLLVIVSFTATVYSVELGDEEVTNKSIKNVILFIGDGMGPNHVDAGGIYLGEDLCFDVVNEKWAYHAYSNIDTTLSLLRPEENKSLYDGTPSPYGDTSLGVSGNITTYTDT